METPTKPLVDPIIHIEPLVNSCFTLYKDLKLSCPKMCELRKAESELWIYGYDFPSKLSPSLVQEFINFLELNFGKVSEYVALPLSYPFADFKFP